MFCLWPVWRAGGAGWGTAATLGGAALAAAALSTRRVRLGGWPFFLAGGAAGAVWLCGALFGGSLVPLALGFGYGVAKHPVLAGNDVANLPALLAARFGWALDEPVRILSLEWAKIPWHAAVTLKHLLWGAYALLLVLCGRAAAVHARRGSARTLVAAAAPWLVFFALLPQMHQRYLVWGAAVTALGVAVRGPAGWCLLVLHLAVTALAWSMQAATLLGRRPDFSPLWLARLRLASPYAAWAVLACALTWLAFALVPTRKREREEMMNDE